MSSTCFEPEGSSLGRRFYMQLWYSMFHIHHIQAVLYVEECVLHLSLYHLRYFLTKNEYDYSIYI